MTLNGIGEGLWSTDVVFVTLKMSPTVNGVGDRCLTSVVLFMSHGFFATVSCAGYGFRGKHVVFDFPRAFYTLKNRGSLTASTTGVARLKEMIVVIALSSTLRMCSEIVESQMSHTLAAVVLLYLSAFLSVVELINRGRST